MHPSPSTMHVTRGPANDQLLSSLAAAARCSSPLQLQQLPTIAARGSPCSMSVSCSGHSCTFISPNIFGSVRCPSQPSPPPTAAVHSTTAAQSRAHCSAAWRRGRHSNNPAIICVPGGHRVVPPIRGRGRCRPTSADRCIAATSAAFLIPIYRRHHHSHQHHHPHHSRVKWRGSGTK
jgi:hypothetical protein